MSPCFVFSSVTAYRKDEQKLGDTHVETALWARYQPSCQALLLGQWPAPVEVGHCSSFLAMNMNFREKILVLEPAVLISPSELPPSKLLFPYFLLQINILDCLFVSSESSRQAEADRLGTNFRELRPWTGQHH